MWLWWMQITSSSIGKDLSFLLCDLEGVLGPGGPATGCSRSVTSLPLACPVSCSVPQGIALLRSLPFVFF